MATAYERVRIARGAKRPTGIDYLQNVFHGFFELHGDRFFADDLAVRGGIAEPAPSIEAGVARAVELGGKGPVCALGTLYFSGDVRKAFAELVKG